MDLHEPPDPRSGSGAIVALALLCPVVPVAVGLVAAYRSPLMFLTTLAPVVLVTFLLVLGAGRWLRSPATARPLDHLVAVVSLGSVGATLMVLLGAAERFGIRGSAVPRITRGTALPADVPYVAATVACLAALVAAVALLLVLLTSPLRPFRATDGSIP